MYWTDESFTTNWSWLTDGASVVAIAFIGGLVYYNCNIRHSGFELVLGIDS
ncbi:MAG: hypothetical protein AB8U25_00945 [Rickettsiales endosymbiont of Dermacentor nuttalli]